MTLSLLHRQDQVSAYLLLGMVTTAMVFLAVGLSLVPAYNRPTDRPYRLVRFDPGAPDGDAPAPADTISTVTE
ncbi:MAG TPA: hypothetical protein VMM13_16110 [Euzebya sp.]|nr:hypothetical protein [Euzebya sp.]